jgi:hypothetical protein
MPGATAYGLHEGSRSEYLAQYVFASWGTAVAIPHQEDHGIDLTCTLMERVGKRFLARLPYTVQVKSTFDPLVFEGEEEVRWVIEHPLPLFLCVVDKPSARLSIYQTLPRFYAWSLGELPERLELVPEKPSPGKVGCCFNQTVCYFFTLSQPILDFTVNQMLDNDFWAKTRQVLEHWIKLENANLTRIRVDLLKCRLPVSYDTNEGTRGSWGELTRHAPNDQEQFERTAAYMGESLEWVGEHLRQKGDMRGAARVALLHRHLFDEEHRGLTFTQQALNELLGKNVYGYAGVDHLGSVLDDALGGQVQGSKSPPNADGPAK